MHLGIMRGHNTGVCEESFKLSASEIGWQKADQLRDSVCGQTPVEVYGSTAWIIWIIYAAISYGVFRLFDAASDN